MTSLRSLTWLPVTETDTAADAAVPAGPWLQSLRHLAAPPRVLANSAAALAGAAQVVQEPLTDAWTFAPVCGAGFYDNYDNFEGLDSDGDSLWGDGSDGSAGDGGSDGSSDGSDSGGSGSDGSGM